MLPTSHLLAFAVTAFVVIVIGGIGYRITDSWFDAQSPNLFWPDDRQWCVATEIDFDSTLVAGSDALIDELMHTPLLETLPIQPGDSLQITADRINRERSH